MIKFLEETNLSPEQFAAKVGIAGMTIRRWMEKPNNPIPSFYEGALQQALLKMVLDNQIKEDNFLLQKLFSKPSELTQRAAIKSLGFPDNMGTDLINQEEEVLMGLSQIGSKVQKREKVDAEGSRINTYKSKGKDWSERITTLTQLIKSKKISVLDKYPAYGALFYLIVIFDLIPDTLPLFGLLDDFLILGFAVNYYKKTKSTSS
ncbi:MAG: DUF1232 domain-containing protein [Bdellovibrionales bacterium]|nr:DUF1232 domain-containing protein [Bdellovibrionales bacterium]